MNLKLINDPKYKERFQSWIRLSHELGHFEPFLSMQVQYIGELDLECLSMEEVLVRDVRFEEKRNSIELSTITSDAFNLGYTWVLCLYEAVRTACQRADERVIQLEKKISEDHKLETELKSELMKYRMALTLLKKSKHSLERIRVPLVKMEPSYRYKDTDFHIAYPIIDARHGVAWSLNSTTVITRKILSEELLVDLGTLNVLLKS